MLIGILVEIGGFPKRSQEYMVSIVNICDEAFQSKLKLNRHIRVYRSEGKGEGHRTADIVPHLGGQWGWECTVLL